MLRFACPCCAAKLKVPAAKAGARLTCPTCRREIDVPKENAGTEMALLDEDPPPRAQVAESARPKEAPGGSTPKQLGGRAWLIAAGVGVLLAIPSEIVLF